MDEICILLENETHLARLYPLRGGKIGSFLHKPSGFELLQPPKDGYPPLSPGMPFDKGDASGFDDVFPSMGGDGWRTKEGFVPLPDHGEIWTMPMRARTEDGAVHLTGEGAALPYAYEKTVRLEGDTLRCSYRIANTGDGPIPAIWVCHCLMRYEPGAWFDFPAECGRMIDLYPGKGALRDRPAGGWNALLPPPPGKAMKFYFTDPVRQGRCAVRYRESGMTAEMTYDEAALPWLGFWITTGGYRGDLNFAFEPASAYCDTVPAAMESGRLRVLQPGEALAFELSIRLCRM